MPYEIELEDQGQDLIRLAVNEKTGVIEDAGLLSWMYAKGNCIVNMDLLQESRNVHYRKDGGDEVWFKYPMTKLTLNGAVLCDVNLVA